MTDQTDSLKAAYFTLGCKLNFSETSTIGKILSSKGITRAAKGETPDLCIVNTCSVTEMADKKGRRLIRSLATRYPETHGGPGASAHTRPAYGWGCRTWPRDPHRGNCAG